MTELQLQRKVIELEIAEQLVDEVGSCEKDARILVDIKQYAIREAWDYCSDDENNYNYIDLATLFDSIDYAFWAEDPYESHRLRELAAC